MVDLCDNKPLFHDIWHYTIGTLLGSNSNFLYGHTIPINSELIDLGAIFDEDLFRWILPRYIGCKYITRWLKETCEKKNVEAYVCNADRLRDDGWPNERMKRVASDIGASQETMDPVQMVFGEMSERTNPPPYTHIQTDMPVPPVQKTSRRERKTEANAARSLLITQVSEEGLSQRIASQYFASLLQPPQYVLPFQPVPQFLYH